MEIVQIEDKNLSHYAYALIDEGEMALIDPARDPKPYYELARQHQASITAVIETHPHADFVSSHLEIHQATGATVLVSSLLGAEYPHQGFDDGNEIKIGRTTLRAMNTPGHSPDSICITVINEKGKATAIFTGDTLFIGDCGRPDLREGSGSLTADRIDLAGQMFHSLRKLIAGLPDEVLVYPAHGAGSLCGRGMSSQNSSTIGIEKAANWCLQEMSESGFIRALLDNQPFVPKYFPYDVELNKKGAGSFEESILKVKLSDEIPSLLDYIIVDTRDGDLYRKGYLKNSINLMDDLKLETWLGSIISPGEKFYLLAENKARLRVLIERIAKIGYEGQIEQAFTAQVIDGDRMDLLDMDRFRKNLDEFTILDIRNPSEVAEKKIFGNSLNIPLYELRERAGEIPSGKPLVVHCAGGYRSAAGASILKNLSRQQVDIFDLGSAVKSFEQ